MRLGLAREPEHRLGRAVAAAGWEPVLLPLVVSEATEQPPPDLLPRADAVLVLSPGGAALAAPYLSPETLVLCQGRGTFEAMGGLAPRCKVAKCPEAESLWELLRYSFPQGGNFVLVRGERSRGHLEAAAQGSPWRIEAWITHREVAARPQPSLAGLDGVLALSPFQAELLAPLAGDLLRFAWGSRAAGAFAARERPAHGTCEPQAEALTRMLRNFAQPLESIPSEGARPMDNAALFQEALTHFPGGVSSPVRAFRAVGGTPKFFRRAAGAWFEDEDGARFLDLCMSWGPLILGHAHADILAAVTEAMVEGFTFGAPSRRELALARRIKAMVPFMEKMRFVSSGTEAVMSALRAARGFTGRDLILKFDGCYHGHADALLVKAGSGLVTFGEPTSAGVPKAFADLTLVASLDDLEGLERLFAEHGDALAAAIIEPIPANNGLLLQDKAFLIRLRELCTKHGALLVFDEVISGFRVAPGGAAERLGITPDLATYGKIIGGGMPVGCYGGRKDVMGCVSPDGPVYQAGTLSGNPVAMAAGLATLERLTPAVYAGLETQAAAWAEAFERIPGLHCPRYGSLLWPLFQPEVKRADRIESGAIAQFNKLHKLMLEQGVYLAPSGYEVGFLSTAHGEAELAHFQKAVAAAGKNFV